MSNVIRPNFGAKNTDLYKADDRFNVGSTGLIMSVNSMIKLYTELAHELFYDHKEHDMRGLILLFEILDTIYNGIILPGNVTSTFLVRRETTGEKHFSIYGVHVSMEDLKDVLEKKSKGIMSDGDFQTEVTFVNFEDTSREEFFSINSIAAPELPDTITLHPNIFNAMVSNISTAVHNHGGFSVVTELDDEGKSPALVGYIPYTDSKYIRILLAISNK